MEVREDTMTLNEHIAKWNGRPVDFDGAYGFQCMDSMHQYIVEVLGLTDRRILAAPVARSVFENFPNVYGNQYFDRIYNSLTAIPKDGDILFWKEPYGYYYNTSTQRWQYAGHVGVSKGSTLWNITAFEQNNPAGTYCHMQQHTDLYKGCLGWLRYKQASTVITDRQALVNIRGITDSSDGGDNKVFRIKQELVKVGV